MNCNKSFDSYLTNIVSTDCLKYNCEGFLDEIKEKIPDEYCFFFSLALASKISSDSCDTIDEDISSMDKIFSQQVSKNLEAFISLSNVQILRKFYFKKVNCDFDVEKNKILGSILKEREIDEKKDSEIKRLREELEKSKNENKEIEKKLDEWKNTTYFNLILSESRKIKIKDFENKNLDKHKPICSFDLKTIFEERLYFLYAYVNKFLIKTENDEDIVSVDNLYDHYLKILDISSTWIVDYTVFQSFLYEIITKKIISRDEDKKSKYHKSYSEMNFIGYKIKDRLD